MENVSFYVICTLFVCAFNLARGLCYQRNKLKYFKTAFEIYFCIVSLIMRNSHGF